MSAVSEQMISHSKPHIIRADLDAVDRVLATGMIAQGQLVEKFEQAVADYLKSAGGVATGSGTASIVLALKALNVRAGDEVILPTYVCKSVAEAVMTIGAVPVLCDVGEQWNMTLETVARKISARTAAIIVVHIFGIPADTYGFREFGLPIIEDCCQAFGARVDGAYAGTIGDVGVFSFHAIKCLTTGEGGMAVTNDSRLLETMRRLRDSTNGAALEARLASPMTDLQAALGLSQLSRYDQFLSRRKELAELYFDELRHSCAVTLPESVRAESIFYRFPVMARDVEFEAARQSFDALGVQVRRGVDRLLHRMIGKGGVDSFPVAERLFHQTVSIPLYPALGEEEMRKVVVACRTIWKE